MPAQWPAGGMPTKPALVPYLLNTTRHTPATAARSPTPCHTPRLTMASRPASGGLRLSSRRDVDVLVVYDVGSPEQLFVDRTLSLLACAEADWQNALIIPRPYQLGVAQ